ncbi:uncharacterized protein [Apostichopus japonicus]|uniref:uncharacterized protein isoform X1 n=1 Tax=Stichopus japonicus TaxID=307972 RepID=UPI003AB4994B
MDQSESLSRTEKPNETSFVLHGGIIYSFSVIGSFIVVIIVLGNFVTIVAFCKDGKLRQTGVNCYIFNLAIADFLVGIITMPVSIASMISPDLPSNYLFCHLSFWPSYFALHASIYMVLLISRDRYLMVKDVIHHKKTQTPRMAKKLVLITYFVILIFSVMFYVLLDQSDRFMSYCSSNEIVTDAVFVGVNFSVDVLLPVSHLVGYNTLMLKHLIQRRRQFLDIVATPCRNEHKITSRNKKVVHHHGDNTTQQLHDSGQHEDSSNTLDTDLLKSKDLRDNIKDHFEMGTSSMASSRQLENNNIERKGDKEVPNITSQLGDATERELSETTGKRGQNCDLSEDSSRIGNSVSSVGYHLTSDDQNVSVSNSNVKIQNSTTDLSPSRSNGLVARNDISIISPTPKCATCERRKQKKNELFGCTKAVKVVVILVSVFLVCWLPFYIGLVLHALGLIQLPPLLDLAFFVLLCANSAVNPILYVVTNLGFRKAVMKLVKH